MNIHLKHSLKYILEGICIIIIMRIFVRDKFSLIQSCLIGITISITLSFLDLYSPTLSSSFRNGVGFIIGTQVINIGAFNLKELTGHS